MERSVTFALVAGLGLLGAIVFLAMTVYPFQYGPVESALLAGALVLFGVFEFVLDDATLGGG